MPEISPSKYLVQATWDDVPHLSAKTKERLLRETLPYLREARSKGTPSLGSGAIYPIPEGDITCDPLIPPDHWRRAYGLDVGWERTAAVWGAWEPGTDILWVYTEHYRSHAEPSVHAAAIRGRGDWIPGVIDPAARGRAQKDGEQLIVQYQQLGLNVSAANNEVEAGLFNVYDRLCTGRLRIARTCTNLLAEYRIYRRDERGRIVKKHDHALDALRYLCMSGIDRAVVKPPKQGRSGHSSVRDKKAGY